MPANKIKPNESMAQSFPKINKSIEDSFEALEKSTRADDNSNTALIRARNTQAQLNTIIIHNGESDAEVLQMRVDEDGVQHETASERLMADFTKLYNYYVKNEKDLEELGYNVRRFGAVGDGITDDAPAIQRALDESNGKKVIIPDDGRTYLIKSPLIIKSNTILEIGNSTTIKRGANINNMVRNDADGTIGGYGANTNIEIVGGVWDANGTEYPTNCSLIAIGHANNIRIRNAKFKEIYNWHYIELNAVQDGLVRDCLFDGYILNTGTEMVQIDVMRDAGVFPWFGPYDNTACNNITIQNNIFRNGKKGFGSHTMVANSPHTNINVLDNYFYGMSNVAVDARHYNRLLVKGNTFENCWKGVMAQSFDTSNPVYGCTIDGNTFSSINTAEDARAIQIWQTVNRGIISNNTINNVGRHGIGVDYGRWWGVKGNVVTNCGQAGIYIYGSSHVTVEGNNCSVNNTTNTSGRYDIMIGYSAVEKNANNVVIGNYTESIGVNNTIKTLVTNNNILSQENSSLAPGNNDRLQVLNNFIGSTWS